MLKHTLPLALAALLLTGCQSNASAPDKSPIPTPAQQKEQALQRGVYEKLVSRVLAREGDLANSQGRDGSFNLMTRTASSGATLNPTRNWMRGSTLTTANWPGTWYRFAGRLCSPNCPRR